MRVAMATPIGRMVRIRPAEDVDVVFVVPPKQPIRYLGDRLFARWRDVPVRIDPPLRAVHHVAELLGIGLPERPLGGQRRETLC